MTLCALSDVKTLLDISTDDTSKDDKLNLLIKKSSAEIQTYLGFSLARATYTEEVHAVNNNQILYVNNRPIQSVSSITNNGVDITDYKLIPVYSKVGGIYLGSGWAGSYYVRGLTHDPVSGAYDIEVTYNAGYYLPGDDNYEEDSETSLPYAITQACMDLSVLKYQINTNGAQGIKAHSEGNISDTYQDTSTAESSIYQSIAQYAVTGVA